MKLEPDIEVFKGFPIATRCGWDSRAPKNCKLGHSQNSGGLDKAAVPVHSQTMRTGVVILLNLIAVMSIAFADETLPVLTAGGQTYSHVTIFKVSATDIYFTSDKGLGNVKLKDLDPEMQSHFHYNPADAATVEKRQTTANDLYHIEAMKPSAAEPAANTEAAAGQAVTRQPGTGKQVWAKSFLDQKNAGICR